MFRYQYDQLNLDSIIRTIWTDGRRFRLKNNYKVLNIKQFFCTIFIEIDALMFSMLLLASTEDWLKTKIMDITPSQRSICLCETAVQSRAITAISGCVAPVSLHVQQQDWGNHWITSAVCTCWQTDGTDRTRRLSYSVNHTQHTHAPYLLFKGVCFITDGFSLLKVN